MTDSRRAYAGRTAVPGQPLVFLATVVLLWTAARIVHYLPGDDIEEPNWRLDRTLPSQYQRPWERTRALSAQGDLFAASAPAPVAPAQFADRAAYAPAHPEASVLVQRPDIGSAMAHHLLWAETLTAFGRPAGHSGSSLADGPLPPVGDRDSRMPDGAGPAARPATGRRWSVYGWSLVRQRSDTATLAPVAQYGGSQAGLIVRYAFGDGPSVPYIYARAAGALANADDRTMAIGLSARPWRRIPVDLAVERRFGLGTRQPDRFVAIASAGGAARLGRSEVRLEGYGQAGVAGLKQGQAFFDLQILGTRPVFTSEQTVLSVGGGLWAGGQQDIQDTGQREWVHRVDMGPRAALVLPARESQMTLALDWRQRVDGQARPASGAVLTLSAGF